LKLDFFLRVASNALIFLFISCEVAIIVIFL